MSKYYYLISGLPEINIDDSKPAYSVASFKSETETYLSYKDKRLINRFFLKYDNKNLLSYLFKDTTKQFDERGSLTKEILEETCHLLKSEDRVPANIFIPSYLTKFIRTFYECEEETEDKETRVSWEDKLSALYYNEAIECENDFFSSWFELNLNIRNIMTALSCRKHDIEKNDYIIGENEISDKLRRFNSRDFNIGSAFHYMTDLMNLAEGQDLIMREKRIDVLRWNWLEEQIFFKTFDIESLIAYLLRIEMIERWTGLDKESGEQTFRSLVTEMKYESSKTLEEFKEKNK